MAFAETLLSLIGDATDSSDIKAIVRRAYLIDVEDNPIRLWEGQGRLFAGGEMWLGTLDANGANHLQSPAVRDDRDGTSPRYEFGLPYVDAEKFAAMKADQDLVRGRDLIGYDVLCQVGEGLRPTEDLQFAFRLAIRSASFDEHYESDEGKDVLIRSVTVLAKSLEYGRSHTPAGTMTDTAQVERARLQGLSSDSGCSMVAKNFKRTFRVPV